MGHAMPLRAMALLAALLLPAASRATECRQITRGTYVETMHPNGAVTMSRVKEGEKFIVINCLPEEANRVWCYIQDLSRTVFSVSRFIETDRLESVHSKVIDFDACLAN